MKIVVLDGYTLNPGDLSWKALDSLGTCTIYERTDSSLVMERSREADVLLTNKVVLDAETIRSLPRLKYIGVLATGYNVVNILAAREQGVVVTNVPSYSTDSVAQLTFALLLELVIGVGRHDEAVHRGKWARNPDFSFREISTIELAGLIMGIVGFGEIGSAVARIAEAFKMEVLVHTRSPGKDDKIKFVDLDVIFTRSDVISLHCPLTPETEGLVNTEHLQMMKRTSFLINTARGPVLDEEALADALNKGRIAGAAIDVLSTEPPPADNPILGAKNCIITPHIAWATLAARKRLMAAVVSNLRAWMEGRPINMVGL
jgi:glycerate dehydrogenase